MRILKSSATASRMLLRALCPIVVSLVCVSLFCATGLSAQTVLVGNQTIEANLDSNATGLAEAFPVTAIASGTVGSINFFLDESNAATKVYLGIYKDSSGKPGSLVTQGSTTQLYPGTWNSVTVTAASLTSGTAYWIAILGTTGGKPYFYDTSTTACHSQTSSQTNLTSLPSTWSKGTTWNTCYISAYAVTGTSPATVMIGDQMVEASLDKNPAGRAEAFPVTANTTGTVGAIDLYLDPTSGSGPVSVGLYADNGGHPGTLLGQGSTTSPVAGNWNQISISASNNTAGQHYWIAVLGTQATSPYFRDRQTTVCHSETTPQSNLTSLPATWSTGTIWNTCYISAYGLPGTAGSPELSISPSTLSFAAIQGGSSPASANLSVTNTGTGTLSFTATSDQTWLTATPASGTAPQTLQVSAAVGSLTAGTYTAHITITATGAQNSPAKATVTFTVSPFVPPSLTASASPAPNANGWNNANVTVSFACTAGSYPIQTCPSPIIVSTEGANQATCGHAVDSMGNSSAQACVNVSLDKTLPTITATISPAPVGGINYGSATVTFTCSDALSGVATCPSPVTDTTIGANQVISGNAADKAGNSKTTSVTLNIQPTTLPTILATPSPAPNANGWNNTNVTVTFTCTAGSYPVQTCPPPVVISTEGANQSICGHAVDTQGNSSLTACASVSLDKTVPTITATVTPAPVGGISYGSATVTFTCSDTLSGVATCPAPITDTTVGSNQQISGTVTDKAGNSNTASVTLNIQPLVLATVVATPSPAPNAAGWNNANVTVTFKCTAGSYPVQTCPAAIAVNTEGANQSTCGHAVDTQGNSSIPVCANVSIDKTPPTITVSATPAPNAAGWNTTAVTVTFTCNDVLSGIASCTNPQTVTTSGANQVISGTATDAAGNTATMQITLNISQTPPQIIPIVTPLPNSAGWNNSNVTVSFSCVAGAAPITSCPAPQVVSTEGANIPVSGVVTDAAGVTASATVVIKLDKTPPTIIPNLSPAPNGSGWETAPVTVGFVCSDSLSGIASCPSPTLISSDGANQPVSGTATDLAGNSASATANVNLEQTPPTISALASPTANSAGWNNTSVTVTFTCTQSVSTIASCSPPQTVTSQGIGQVISGTVRDQAGQQNTASVTLNIDETPPAILQFTGPVQLSPGQSGTASLSVSDIAPAASAVFQLNGSPAGTVLAPPYTVTVTAPSDAISGSTLTLTAVVTDVAGNASSANIGIKVASSGVIVGEVLSDTTGLPLAGATLQVIGQTGQTDTSDAQGRYSIPVTGSQLFLSVSQPGNSGSGIPAMVTVERQVTVQSGVGTVPVDARLTAVAPPIVIAGSGGTVGAGAITVTVAPGGTTASFNLTPLSQQGLPGLLPLGWSPVAAFDLQANPSASAALSANFTGLPTATLYFVSYSYSVHAWNMVTPNLTTSNGSLTVSLPSTGDYALVVADAGNASLQIAAAGQPLTGVPMVALPTTATGTGAPSPANLAPAGGTSLVTLSVQSATTVPSGTVIQSEVTEKYTLTSGQQISEEPRYEDLLLYQYPAPSSGSTVGATFPVTPSQTFQPSQLSSGDLHLDILSGRESVRGQTGGSDAVAVTSGDATLTVAAGSLPQDTAIAVSPEGIDTFIPSTSTLVPRSEYSLDFSGEVLNNTAQLSVGTAGAAPGSNVLIAQIQRVAGVPFLVVVGTAVVTTTNMVSQVTPGLPGITEEGDYVFYELTVPTGFVGGTVSASSGPVAAMVQTDALPFVAFSTSNGSYMIAAAAGTVNLTASIPSTALAGTAMAQVIAGQTATANLTVVGQVESATITPANGAVGVPLTAEIDLVAAEGFNPATVTSSSVVLTAAGSTTPIALRFVYSAGNTKLAVFPQAALQPSTQYTFQASGLANAVGGLISVPTISFTTVAITPPTYNTNALVFGMPDQNGNVAISAPAGSFPAGSTILIVDQTNGVVYSLTVFNDGSVTGQMPATINDTLQVTLTDPAGNTTTFTISQFVAADGTTAIGPGGGTVVGPSNTGIIIPAGALSQGVTFQLTQLDQTSFPVLPTWTGANFGSGLRIHDPAMPTFKKEAKLAFPVPTGAPGNAFYYVYRRLTDQNGNPYFETIDEAFVQSTGASAQVVTASPPFCGYHNSYGNFSIQADSPPLPITMEDQDYFVMWDATAQHGPSGLASTGLIVGLAQQIVPAVIGVSPATTQPAQGTVTISLDEFPNQVAIYDGTCATFTLFDPHLGGGARNLTATQTPANGLPLHATADEVDGAQSDDGLYAIYAGLEDLYKNIGRINFLFPAATPPPPPPAINVQVFTLDQNGHRVPAAGILQSNTNVVIAFQSGLSVQSASINGSQLDVETPDSTDGEVLDGKPESNLLSARVKNLYPLGGSGAYTITATAVDPISLTVTTASQSILVVAAGGSNSATFTCTAAQPPADPTTGCVLPQVVNVSPTNLATSVSPAVFPVVTFNEPVTNISSANVVVTVANVPSNPASQIGSVVPVVLVGVRVPNPNQSPIADPVQPSDVITSLTIEPVSGLGYNETYNLTLNASAAGGCVNANNHPAPQSLPTSLIVDLNQAPTGPFCLPAYGTSSQPYQFTTFGPQDLGGVTSQYAVLTRPVIIGNTAYTGEYLSSAISGLGMFDVTNPSNPADLGVGASFVGRAIDVAGQAQSPVTGAGLVAISSGTAVDNTIPANVWLYDVSSPTPNRVGAVSVTSDTSYGIALRLFMKDQYLYASTFEQGLQVIDLGQAIAEYSQTPASQFGQSVSTAGDGFAMDAIVNTIPIPLTTGGQATMFDLKADNFATNGGGTQTLVVAAGQLPFVMVDPTLSGSSAILYPPNTGGTFSTNPVQSLSMTSSDGNTKSLLCYGTAVDLGTIAVAGSNGSSTSEHIAVVVGNGITGPVAQVTGCPVVGQPPALPVVPVLAVVNVSTTYSPGSPLTPQLIGFLQLPTTGTDVVLNGSTALISTGSNVLLVSLVNPAQPVSAGQITGNFGNWLAVTSGGIAVGSSNGSSGNGIQTTTLGSYIVIQNMTPTAPQVDDSGKTTQAIQLTLNAQGQAADFQNAQVLYSEDGVQATTISVGNLQPGTQTVTIPAGLQMTTSSPIISVTLTKPDGTQTPDVSLLLNSPGYLPSTTTSGGSSGSGGGSTGQSGSALSASPFSSITPAAVQLGSSDTVITVGGAAAASLSQVYVRGLDSQWNAISVTSSTATSAQFTVPASLFSQAGFLEVGPAQDDGSSIPLMVYDSTLPAVGSLPGLEVDVADAETDSGALLVPSTFFVSGANFTAGMQVVLGRGITPGLVLPTTLLDANTLQAQIPTPFAAEADDLFAAVLSADGTQLSTSVPYPRPTQASSELNVSTISPGVDPVEAASVAQFGSTETGITSISGNLVETLGSAPTQTPQTLTINGANLSDGMTVTFSTMKGGQILQMTSPLTSTQTVATLTASSDLPPISATSLMSSKVQVPTQITDTKSKAVGVQSAHAKSGTVAPNPEKAAVVPFGGRTTFGVFQEPIGEIHIVPLSKTMPSTYQPVLNAVITIASAAPNYRAYPTIQLEHEDGDQPYTARIRGTALTQLPCPAIQKLKLTPAISCSSTMGAIAQLQATQNGKVIATRNVESKALPLGSNTQYDSLAQYYGDYWGVPPNYLKAQALQESGGYSSNFRFEFGTINVGCLSADLGTRAGACDGTPHIPTEPFTHYILGGTSLGTYRLSSSDKNSAQETQCFDYSAADPENTQFELSVPVKRTVGGILEQNPKNAGVEAGAAVYASIQSVAACPKSLTQGGLQLVHSDTIFQRSGGTSTGVALKPGQFAVNYSNGNITLGQQLAVNQMLVVGYWPVQSGYTDGANHQTVIPTTPGDYVNNQAPDLTSTTLVKQDKGGRVNFQGGAPTPSESLSAFLQRNIPHGSVFLSVTDADKYTEFSVDANNNPTAPRDPRYLFMTSQPYASSSYGILQLTLLAFLPGSRVQLNQQFNPGFASTNCPAAAGGCAQENPIFQLLTQPHTNFNLAGFFHRLSYTSLAKNAPFCDQTSSCTEPVWQSQWTQIINQYNPNGNGYTYSYISNKPKVVIPGGLIVSGIVNNGARSCTPQSPTPDYP